MLPVCELFETIQGEATWTGTPSVFVRLQGCDVGCSFCDTKHTWELNPQREISLGAMLAKETDSSSYAAVAVPTLVSTIASFKARHVVITGGEPCRYNLHELTESLMVSGYSVQIESSGTEPVRVYGTTWITISPKIDMPGKRSVLPDVVAGASEIKMPIGRKSDIEKLRRFLDTIRFPAEPPPIWLQPLSASPKATALCIEACLEFGWKLSIQTHKFIGVR